MGPSAAPEEREAAARWTATAVAMAAIAAAAVRRMSVKEMVRSAGVVARPVRSSSWRTPGGRT